MEEQITQSTSFWIWLKLFFEDGGVFMWVIAGLWAASVTTIFMKFRHLHWVDDIDGSSLMNEIQRYILSSDIQGAIRVCSSSKAALSRVLKGGLKRAQHTTDQIQNALDATALEVIPKVESKLHILTLNANMCMLFGLLGTIQGLIVAFSAIAKADPAQKAEILSKGISTAMNTTALGLFGAITILFLHAYLNARSQKIINEIDEFSVKLLDLLTTKSEQNKNHV
jgi:biopolymer transport protein ExbB